ncbi:hypothetical protein SAMN06265350_101124 [Solitalea koreensis]|uniref:Uncharacterized protein n=1 Tax=Solitalea koreensis TaxID=543615 RepID=A0A521AFV3_9SPHI|nr:hypothetical protein SAMN06265350_101124 [Solitalea koreensis]
MTPIVKKSTTTQQSLNNQANKSNLSNSIFSYPLKRCNELEICKQSDFLYIATSPNHIKRI